MHIPSFIIRTWLDQCGDTTFWSWIITGLYGVTILLSLYYVKKYWLLIPHKWRILWSLMVAFLIFMGINKQLDIQILLDLVENRIAWHHGGMEYLSGMQSFVFEMVLLTSLGFMVLLIYAAKKNVFDCRVELSGIGVLIIFVLIRAGTMCNMSGFAFFEVRKLPHVHALELAGVAIFFCAILLRMITEGSFLGSIRSRARDHQSDNQPSRLKQRHE